ncbi:MAG: ATP-binding protein [Akkermansiaceae bacterium]|nr:ATP-binding protein [Akkermansiaceae bacterium]MCF7732743.1 ATP-binding protein [Akkermansiaceae bacterium]
MATTPSSKSQRGALAISRGRITRPQKAVIYGPEGVGKSTLASLTPGAVFLDTEGGTHHLDVTRLDAVSSWEEIKATVARLTTAQHPFKTLVIDTADWLEKRLAEHLCAKANKDSIEDFGYGKGWVLLAEEFGRFITSLDALLARGMHVIFLAHSTVRKFEAPDQAGSYDRFELKLSKQAAPLLKEWADLVLFANYVTKVAEKDSGKMRGVGGKERVLFTTHTAAYDAKNRHGLPDKLPFTIDALAPVFGAQATAGSQTPSPTEPSPTLSDRIFETFQRKTNMANVVDFLVARGQLGYTEEGPLESIDNLDPAYAARMLADPGRFVAAVEEWAKEKEATK